MRFQTAILLILIVALLAFAAGEPHAYAHIEKKGEILVLLSYSPDYEWTISQQRGIVKTLAPLSHDYTLRIEYMDTNHNPDLADGSQLRQLYQEKFVRSHFKVILVSDNTAFDFMRQYRDELFPGVPVVFCGVNNFEDRLIANLPDFTGVAEDNDYIGLFELMLRLHPNTNRIVIYSTADDPSGTAISTQVQRITATRSDLQKLLDYRRFPDYESCIADAKQLGPDSLLMVPGNMRALSGERINAQQAVEIMSEEVNLPIYTAWDFGIDHGAVGGLVMSGEDQGRLAAEMAARILGGEPPRAIPVLRNVSNVYRFDYKQLVRFGINPSLLPAGSTIVNSPVRTYSIAQEALWTGAISLALMTLITAGLIMAMRRRKAAEASLIASEEKFSKAFRQCADIVGIVRVADDLMIEVSDAFYQTFGFSREEVINKKPAGYSSETAFCIWADARDREKLVQILVEAGQIKNWETRFRTKAGDIRTGLYSGEVVIIGNEKCLFFTWHDITEQKQAEEALRQTLDTLEQQVEQRTQELTALNEELSAMNEELSTMNEELQKTNADLFNEVTERRRVEGELAETNRSLTRALEELKEMQAYLIQSEKMAALGSLVAGVAHEISTPVGVGVTAASHLTEAARRFAEYCANGSPRRQDVADYLDDLQESSTIILKNLERAAKLIHSFKRVSVDQSGEVRRVFNIRKYLEEILLSMHPNLKKTNHRVVLDCDESLSIDGFPGALSQIVANFIMNSLLHAYGPDDQGTIRIAARREDGRIVLEYSDDGKGMDAATLSKIFDPFFTTKRGKGGTGLGLYVVYNIITQQYGGTVECESAPGKGTTFRVLIPLKKEV